MRKQETGSFPRLGRGPAFPPGRLDFPLEIRSVSFEHGPNRHDMRHATFFTILLLLSVFATSAGSQETVVVATASSKPRPEIPPSIRCHTKRKDLSFCKVFPNFSRRKGICDPALLGHIEWCREDVTITERSECGNYETYEAVTITYREVFANGAWGEKFRKTYRKEAFAIVTPPVLAK